jgi:molybdenum cofactor biosynthesis enzyme MoaA
MSEENERCCCGCQQRQSEVNSREVVDKMKRRNLISAIILLILAVIFAVWHLWGKDYVTESRYKESLAEELAENNIEYSNIEVKNDKYVVTLKNGATLTYVVLIDPETNTYCFDIDKEALTLSQP